MKEKNIYLTKNFEESINKYIKYILFFFFGLIAIIFIKRFNVPKDGPAWVERLSQEKEIILKVECCQGEGITGTVVDSRNNGVIKNGEYVMIIFNPLTKVIQEDGSTFVYDDENPNAEFCDISEHSTVIVIFDSYVNISGHDIPFRIDAIEIRPY